MRVFILFALLLTGCASDTVSRIMGGPESPRPKPYQVTDAKETTTTTITHLTNAQNTKVAAVVGVVDSVVGAVKDGKFTSPAALEFLSNVNANAVQAIDSIDGTAKYASNIGGMTAKEILNMPLGEYMMYAAGQTVVAGRQQEAVYKAAKLGFQWSLDKIAMGGGLLGTIGGLATFLGLNKNARNKLLTFIKKRTKALEKFKAKHPDTAADLDAALAEADATTPLDTSNIT